MVNNRNEHTREKPANQGLDAVNPKPIKIGASTPFDLPTFCYTSLSL